MKEELIQLDRKDGGSLALWRYRSESGAKKGDVLLTHGTFSNRKVLKVLTGYLVEHQYNCWLFEWRNHGSSTASVEKFDFETIGQEDFKLVMDFLFEERRLEQIDCITHSGGGICLTIALIAHPHFRERIKSISMFACQAFGAADSGRNLAQIFLGKHLSKMKGKVPASKTGSEEDEPYSLMKQWFDWNLTGTFKGKSGIDYKKRMKEIKTPVLSVFGGGDTFIAPPSGCRKFLSAFENPANEALLCSKKRGFAENYSHSRVLHSRNAKKEIYPIVLNWMDKHSSSSSLQ